MLADSPEWQKIAGAIRTIGTTVDNLTKSFGLGEGAAESFFKSVVSWARWAYDPIGALGSQLSGLVRQINNAKPGRSNVKVPDRVDGSGFGGIGGDNFDGIGGSANGVNGDVGYGVRIGDRVGDGSGIGPAQGIGTVTDDYAEQQRLKAEQLSDAIEMGKVAASALDMAQAQTSFQKLQVQYAEDKRQIEGKYGELLSNQRSEQEAIALGNARDWELSALRLDNQKELNRLTAEYLDMVFQLPDADAFGSRFTGKELPFDPNANVSVVPSRVVAQRPAGAGGQISQGSGEAGGSRQPGGLRRGHHRGRFWRELPGHHRRLDECQGGAGQLLREDGTGLPGHGGPDRQPGSW